ncbi:type II toxin-antitoxin system ParD family antitoxin [Vibrio parahaemolyticus]
MRSALKPLQQQETQLEVLKQAVDAGRQSGISSLTHARLLLL